MINEFDKVINVFNDDIKKSFSFLCELVYKETNGQAMSKLWARMPSFYLNNKFVRIIPFKDHINIEASAISKYAKELINYKITPKGFLQIRNNQIIPVKILRIIISESLS